MANAIDRIRVLVTLCLALALAAPLSADQSIPAPVAKVKNLELIHADGGVIVRVHTGAKNPFTHDIAPAKNGKPYRIILDCQDADHALGAHKFASLPQSVIASIRTSQYAVTPRHITRIVLDLNKESFYRVSQEDKYIDLYVTDRSAKRFNTWSATTWLAGQSTNSTTPAAEKPAVAVAKSEPAKVEKTEPQPKATTPKVEQPAAKPMTVAKSEPAKVESPKPQPKATTPKVEQPATKPMTVAKSEPAKVETPKPQPKATTPKAEKPMKTEVAAATKAPVDSKKSTLKPKVASTQQSPAAQKVSAPTQKKPAVKPATVAAKESKNSKVNNSASTAKKAKKADSPKSVKSAKAEQTKAKVKNPKADSQERSLFASTAVAADKPAESGSTDDEKGYSAKFRRTLEDQRAVKLKGTQVAEFPKRLTIQYKAKGSRDPFKSLFFEEKQEDGPFTNVPPNIEALTMVGILRDVKGKTRGLFEDIDGRGYILTKGDKVKNGTVLKVTETKAYFQIFEYGWSRTVALKLEG